ncbi:MAG: hypothetical protein O7B25_04660 [Gammaproteobacteria bacterium]|nr:hypothetical protein [Gammaproteobacteria bacterium]
MFDVLVMLVASLDSLPNMGRLFLSAGLLALLLGLINARIAPINAAMGVSYRKSALLALLIVPALAHVVFGVRLVLLVEALPVRGSAPDTLWWSLLAGWLVGVGYFGIRRVGAMGLRAMSSSIDGNEAVDDKLVGRLDHWRNRLTIARDVRLAAGDNQIPLASGVFAPRIVLPRAVAHWPLAAQDLLIARELCYLKRNTRMWFVIGEIVAVLYWPIPWVREIAVGLGNSLKVTCDRLAMSCFNDRLGYERASRQLEQRLQTRSDEKASIESEVEWEPEADSPSGPAQYRRTSQRKDPQYDRVFWLLLQAMAVVFILTGTTLRQLEVLDHEELDLAERWYFSYERSSDYIDQKVESTRTRAW